MTFFIPLRRSKFLLGIFFLPEGILLTFLFDRAFISSSSLKWRTVFLDRWKSNKVKLTIAPAYFLEFSGHSTRRVTQAEPGGVPELKCTETNVAECREQSSEEERAAWRENSRDVWRSSNFPAQYWSAHIWGNNQRPEKKYPKGQVGMVAIPHTVSVLTNQTGSHRIEYSEGICLRYENLLALD